MYFVNKLLLKEKIVLQRIKTFFRLVRFPGFWFPSFWKLGNQRKPLKTRNLFFHLTDAFWENTKFWGICIAKKLSLRFSPNIQHFSVHFSIFRIASTSPKCLYIAWAIRRCMCDGKHCIRPFWLSMYCTGTTGSIETRIEFLEYR